MFEIIDLVNSKFYRQILTAFFAGLFHYLGLALFMWIPDKSRLTDTVIVRCFALFSIQDAECALV